MRSNASTRHTPARVIRRAWIYHGPVGGSLYKPLNTITINGIPDLITKAAWDPDFVGHIHIEVGGILRNFTDQAYWGNHSRGRRRRGRRDRADHSEMARLPGFGHDRQRQWPLWRGANPDATFNWQGGIQPIHERQVMIGLTAHVTPQTDVYVFAGGEFACLQLQLREIRRGNALRTAGLYSYGYGNPAYENIGCNFEGRPDG